MLLVVANVATAALAPDANSDTPADDDVYDAIACVVVGIGIERIREKRRGRER